LGLLLTLLLGLALQGCVKGIRPAEGPEPLLTDEERHEADRLFERAQQEHLLQRDRQALDLAFELLDRYGFYERNDEVMLLAVRAAQRLGDLTLGRQVAAEFLARYPTSPHVNDVLGLGAEMAAAAADTFAAVDLLLRRHARLAAGPAREAAAAQIAPLLARLGGEELGRLIIRDPRGPLRPQISYWQVRSLVAAARLSEARQSLEALRLAAPQSEWLAAAERLLSEPGLAGPEPGQAPVAGAVNPSLVGILCPLTGRYAILGNAFYDGALLAVRTVNEETGRQFELKVEDTEADPVVAALGARRLATEEGAIALIGSLLSAPTVAAALEADRHGIPFISPTATNERVWQLGPFICQLNRSEAFEARLLARLGTQVLLKQRFAVLYPDTRDGEMSRQLWSQEVQDSGGRIVAAVAFGAEDTDFRAPLLEIMKGRPEVVLIQATADQMILLGPQLDFYHVGALVMGPSSWNSPRLVREAGAMMERAVFPSETALFPAVWTERFETVWRADNLPEEATPLALKAFQATMLVLDALAGGGITDRDQLAEVMRARLGDPARDAFAIEDIKLAAAVRIIENEAVAPFPAELFAKTWTARADSLATTGPDTLLNQERK
jgi:branched-chain amino acid transport system substrate-binding protein